jgi:hypothetical protein
LFGFRDDESRYVFRNGFSRALSGKNSTEFTGLCVLHGLMHVKFGLIDNEKIFNLQIFVFLDLLKTFSLLL